MTSTNESFLRRSLLANALFTSASGLALVFASSTLPNLIGAVGSTELIVVGVVLLFYAIDLARTALGAHLPRGRIYYFIILDVLWVLGSALVLWGITVPFTAVGRWIIVSIADAVGLFAVFQYVGLRRLSKKKMEAAPTV